MAIAEMAYLAMVITAFCTFISVVGFISTWSSRPSAKQDQSAQATALTAKRRVDAATHTETITERAA